MNVIKYNGTQSDTLGLIVANSNSEVSASRSFEKINVPGRNGTVLIDNGNFDNITISYDVVLTDASIPTILDLSRWLLSPAGYCRLEESEKPEYYRMAVFNGNFEAVRTALNEKGKATLTFECMPQRFLLNNGADYVIDMDVSGGLYTYTNCANVGDFPYKPRFEITFPTYTFTTDTQVQLNAIPAGELSPTVIFDMTLTGTLSGKTLVVDFEEMTVTVDGAFPGSVTICSMILPEMGNGIHEFAAAATTNSLLTPITLSGAKIFPRSWRL